MKKRTRNELLMLCGLSALALYATRNRKLSLIPTAAAGLLLTQTTERVSFRGQSVLITGGSRGLGLALARELIKENANVTLLARDAEELTLAQHELNCYQCGEVHTIVCDVTDPDQLAKAIHDTAKKFHGIDMLINNAGSIVVGPWESMNSEDYQAQLNLHLFSVINATKCVLPYLRQQQSGKRIVNICSMGGRVAVPHMVPYDTSKFALSGFSQGVGAELAHEGISVTTIYPGLMRTGSPIQAVFKGDHEKEFAWFQSADVFPGISTDVTVAAKQIIEAARDRRWELMPFLPAKIRMVASVIFPELVGGVMALVNKLLPRGQSYEYKTGAQSRELFDKLPLTSSLAKAAHKAEEKSNQHPKTDAKKNMGLLH